MLLARLPVLLSGHGGADVAEHLTECLPGLVAQRCRHIEEHGVEEVGDGLGEAWSVGEGFSLSGVQRVVAQVSRASS